jgi:polynucleotide 5'-hydroxyl-kinase GRC3/NOL9
MEDDQGTSEAKIEAVSEPEVDSSQKVADDDEANEQSPRGQKRPLITGHDNDVSTTDAATTTKDEDLPPGVTVSWKDNCDLIADFSMETSAGSSSASDTAVVGSTLQLCLVGRARIRCLEGTAEVLGHTITPESEEVSVSSPFWSSWMTIHVPTPTASQPATKLQVSSVRGSPSFRLVPPNRPTVIPPSWKSSADQICQDFVNAPPPAQDSLEEDAPFLHPKDPVVVICGAKGVGKSTFLRYLNNRLLQTQQQPDNSNNNLGHPPSAVAILDADVGQPELAPPGILRLSLQRRPLLHPPYWNLCDQSLDEPVEQISSVYYGAVTSKVDPTRYIEAVQRLLQDYHALLAQSPTTIPLLINLDGWIKGMGFQILTTLISSTNPSHVCQLLGDTKAKMFDLSEVVVTPPQDGDGGSRTVATAATSTSAQLFFLDVCTKHVNPCSIPASTLRTLRFATYFGPHMVELWDALDFLPAKQLQTGWSGDDDCTLARYLARERPYCVPMESVQCSHSNTGIMAEWNTQDREQRETQYIQALNGCIVGLSTGGGQENCIGLGIVRSIDEKNRLFYILTPVHPDQLSRVQTLVSGNLPLPLPLIFRGVYAESFPYLTTLETITPNLTSSNGDEKNNTNTKTSFRILGSEPMKSRNNIGRRGFVGGGGK